MKACLGALLAVAAAASFVSVEDSLNLMQTFSTKYKLNYGIEV